MSVLHENRLPAPAFPLDAFGERLAPLLSELAESKSAPVDYVAGSLLATAAGLIGNARKASPWPGFTEPSIIWCCNVGSPSTNKSPAQDAILGPLETIEEEMGAGFPQTLRDWKTEHEASKAAHERWKADVREADKKGTAIPPMPDAAVIPDKPELPRVRFTDATPEKWCALAATLSKGLLFVRDEASGWLASFGRYGADGERALWLEAYGGRRYIIDRVKHAEPIVIPRLSVSVLGSIQPDRLNTCLLKSDDDGLAARLLYLWPEPVPPRPAEIDAGYISAHRRDAAPAGASDERG